MLDKAEYSASESTLNSPIVSYRIVSYARQHICVSAYMPSPVRPSVCLSVTRVDHTKKVEVRIMKLVPPGSPMILVFCCQISSPNSKGFPRTGASKKGGVWKFRDFLDLSVNISKTVADTAKVTISH